MMRFLVALVFVAAVFACVFTSGTAVAGFRLLESGGISDPQHIAEKFRSALYLHAAGGSLTAASLLLMTVQAFMHRAKARGIVTALLTLLAGAIAALAILDVGAISDAAQSFRAKTPQERTSEVIGRPGVALFGRMSLQAASPHGISHVLAMANVRVLGCLCFIGLGASLALAGTKVTTTTTSIKPPPL
jgi:hypothetical protein